MRLRKWILGVVFGSIAASGTSQSLTWLGVLPSGTSSKANAISQNGVVVGEAVNASGQWRAFRWESTSGMQDLGTLGGTRSRALAISADGSVIVGVSTNSLNQDRAFRWDSSTGMQDLGTLGGTRATATAVSADGSVIAGWAHTAANATHAFRWQGGSMQDLGTLGGSASLAYGVSADGNAIVGDSNLSQGWQRAFYWSLFSGMQNLNTLGGTRSRANAISADGQVVVGVSYNDSVQVWVAFRWTQATGMQALGGLPYFWGSEALATSCDGSVTVGRAYGTDPLAVRWVAGIGIDNLNVTYANLLPAGSILYEARGVSPNGRYIVGTGYNSLTNRAEAFLLDTGCPRENGDVDQNGCVDDADLLEVLFAFGSCRFRADVNCDGVVDDADLLVVLFHFGEGC